MRRRRIDARTVASHVAIWGLPTASDSESGSMSATESGHEFSSDGDASDSDDRVVAGGGGALELSPPPASPSTMPDALEPELEPLTRARGLHCRRRTPSPRAQQRLPARRVDRARRAELYTSVRTGAC